MFLYYLILQKIIHTRVFCILIQSSLHENCIHWPSSYQVLDIIARREINYNYCYFYCDRCVVRILSERTDICNGNDVAIVLITRTILLPSYSSRHKRHSPNHTTRLIDVHRATASSLFSRNIRRISPQCTFLSKLK